MNSRRIHKQITVELASPTKVRKLSEFKRIPLGDELDVDYVDRLSLMKKLQALMIDFICIIGLNFKISFVHSVYRLLKYMMHFFVM